MIEGAIFKKFKKILNPASVCWSERIRGMDFYLSLILNFPAWQMSKICHAISLSVCFRSYFLISFFKRLFFLPLFSQCGNANIDDRCLVRLFDVFLLLVLWQLERQQVIMHTYLTFWFAWDRSVASGQA